MKLLALCGVLFASALLHLADRFADAKIENDSAIAADTRRIAEAIERCLISVHSEHLRRHPEDR